MGEPAGERIGIVGVGVMGGAIARRFLAQGCEVAAFDPAPARLDEVAALGAHRCASPMALAREVEVVILSLNRADIVADAVFGSIGVAAGARPGQLLVDMSSIDPASTQEFARRAATLVGLRWVDAPLSGGVPAAERGALTIMAGGTEQDVAYTAHALRHVAANVTHMGPVGAGQTAKLVNQVLVGGLLALMMESCRLAEACGLDVRRLPDALRGGRADSRVLQEFLVKMADRDYSPTGRIDNMLKDLTTAHAAAGAANVAMPLTAANLDLHRWLVGRGLGPADSAAMMEYYATEEPT